MPHIRVGFVVMRILPDTRERRTLADKLHDTSVIEVPLVLSLKVHM